MLEIGVGLCSLFNAREQSAPTIILHVTEEIETKARKKPDMDLYQIYRVNLSAEKFEEMRPDLCKGSQRELHPDLCKSPLKEMRLDSCKPSKNFHVKLIPDCILNCILCLQVLIVII